MAILGSAKPPYFEEVFMFSHQEHVSVHPFIQIETGDTRPLHVSAGHYLWGAPQLSGARPSLYRAADLKAGDYLWTMGRDNGNGLVCTQITRVKLAQAVGLYNPHTPSGPLVVNGIAATTFTDVLPASLEIHQLVTYPARILYHMLPFKHAREGINNLILAMYFKLPDIVTAALTSLMWCK